MPQSTVPNAAGRQRKERRIARLQQQLQLLETMDSSLWRKAIFCSIATFVVAIAAVVGLLLLGEKMPEASTVIYALIGVIAIFMAIRFWNPFLWTIFILGIMLSLAVIFDDVFLPDRGGAQKGTGSPTGPDALDFTVDEKSKHRRRIERAIEKRKLKLRRLLAN
jgi:predicted membrane channel-forming protein YqfA (hemolysin III family)